MKKDLRRQIKQDELVTTYERASHWVAARRDEVRITLIVLAVVGLGAAGFRWYERSRQQASEQAFAEALTLFEAPVAADLPAGQPAPPGPVHATPDEKFQKAKAAFDGMASRYGSFPAGRRARYYAALCRLELKDFAEAEKALQEVAAGPPNALETSLARMALAEAHWKKGQLDQAADAFRKIVDDPSTTVPRDHLLMRLGAVLEEARKLTEAGASYKRVVEEFPMSAYATEARRRMEVLGVAQG